MATTTPLDHNAALRMLVASHGRLQPREVVIASDLLRFLAESCRQQSTFVSPGELDNLAHALRSTAGLAAEDQAEARSAWRRVQECGAMLRLGSAGRPRLVSCDGRHDVCDGLHGIVDEESQIVITWTDADPRCVGF